MQLKFTFMNETNCLGIKSDSPKQNSSHITANTLNYVISGNFEPETHLAVCWKWAKWNMYIMTYIIFADNELVSKYLFAVKWMPWRLIGLSLTWLSVCVWVLLRQCVRIVQGHKINSINLVPEICMSDAMHQIQYTWLAHIAIKTNLLARLLWFCTCRLKMWIWA